MSRVVGLAPSRHQTDRIIVAPLHRLEVVNEPEIKNAISFGSYS